MSSQGGLVADGLLSDSITTPSTPLSLSSKKVLVLESNLSDPMTDKLRLVQAHVLKLIGEDNGMEAHMAEQDEPPISDDALYQILTDALPVEFIGEDYFEEFILEGDSLASILHKFLTMPFEQRTPRWYRKRLQLFLDIKTQLHHTFWQEMSREQTIMRTQVEIEQLRLVTIEARIELREKRKRREQLARAAREMKRLLQNDRLDE
ncbi:MAG: hypothetical protein NXY57DRAFT_963554 [Lentinula lateritia]|uniref:Uncharacterized protein n=1 Tax=Lentinula lateritia TaxID=40482 RepID=A0ABQ8VJQ4_9AGAR|nr:MAG: hypothetical protein NXY57DRAFT_963554 [Lentinula lateritia]KAJ4496626.1 hypothetical protein C8R41DRAFT_918196 [Lentinula lateritia]